MVYKFEENSPKVTKRMSHVLRRQCFYTFTSSSSSIFREVEGEEKEFDDPKLDPVPGAGIYLRTLKLHERAFKDRDVVYSNLDIERKIKGAVLTYNRFRESCDSPEQVYRLVTRNRGYFCGRCGGGYDSMCLLHDYGYKDSLDYIPRWIPAKQKLDVKLVQRFEEELHLR